MPGPSPSHRATRRHGCNRFRPLRVLHNGMPVPGWTTVRDVSRQGIGLLGQTRFESGAVLTVQLPHKSGFGSTNLNARVRHSQALPGGRWVTGCRLGRPLEAEELRALL